MTCFFIRIAPSTLILQMGIFICNQGASLIESCAIYIYRLTRVCTSRKVSHTCQSWNSVVRPPHITSPAPHPASAPGGRAAAKPVPRRFPRWGRQSRSRSAQTEWKRQRQGDRELAEQGDDQALLSHAERLEQGREYHPDRGNDKAGTQNPQRGYSNAEHLR